MHQRIATHAEAVYVARALNLQIEAVWQIIQGRHYTSYADLELVVHTAFLQRRPDAAVVMQH
jgi:hypothetical protein